MHVGITGTRAYRPQDEQVLGAALAALPGDAILVTGGCVGVDTAAAWLWAGWGGTVHIVLPADRRQVDPGWETYATTAEMLPPGTTYRDRNTRIISLSETLLAFPAYPEGDTHSRRSGTWMTVRIARRAGVPVTLHLLRDGAPPPAPEGSRDD